VPIIGPDDHSKIKTLEGIATELASLSLRLETAVRHITAHHKLVFIAHFIALCFETTGTILALFSAIRINARLPENGFPTSDSQAYRACFYHLEVFGFGLLLGAILLQCLVVFLEHRALHKAAIKLSTAEQD
jgi:hypothetical protein